MIEEQAVRIQVSAAKLAGSGIFEVMRLLLQNLQDRKFGQQSIKELNRQEKQLVSLDVNSNTVSAVKKELKSYAVDFAVTKEKDTGKMYLWFKGQDVERIQAALQHCIAAADKAEEQGSPNFAKDFERLCQEAKERSAQSAVPVQVPTPEIGERG